MKIGTTALRFLPLLLLAGSPTIALAQDIATPVFDMSVITNNAAMESLRQSELSRAGRGGGFEMAPARSIAPQSQAQLRYRTDSTVRARNFSRFVSRASKADPVGARKLANALKDGKVIQNAQSWMSRYGLSTNNIADASATYLAIAWYATRASDKDPSPAQIKGLRRQMAMAMVATPGVTGASDSVKQEMAESNLIQAQLVSEYATLARTNPAKANDIKHAVAQGARSAYGIDLMKVQFTPDGFQ